MSCRPPGGWAGRSPGTGRAARTSPRLATAGCSCRTSRWRPQRRAGCWVSRSSWSPMSAPTSARSEPGRRWAGPTCIPASTGSTPSHCAPPASTRTGRRRRLPRARAPGGVLRDRADARRARRRARGRPDRAATPQLDHRVPAHAPRAADLRRRRLWRPPPTGRSSCSTTPACGPSSSGGEPRVRSCSSASASSTYVEVCGGGDQVRRRTPRRPPRCGCCRPAAPR